MRDEDLETVKRAIDEKDAKLNRILEHINEEVTLLGAATKRMCAQGDELCFVPGLKAAG